MLIPPLLIIVIALGIVVTITIIICMVAIIIQIKDNKGTTLSQRRGQKGKQKIDPDIRFTIYIANCVTAVFASFLILALIPFNPKFWTYAEYDGTIQTIKSQVIQNGDKEDPNITGEFAIILNGKKDIFTSEDSRLQTYEAGDQINLICSWQWVYAGSDKLNCSLNNKD